MDSIIEGETMHQREWSACSFYLNPIKHLWDTLELFAVTFCNDTNASLTVRDMEIAFIKE